jgi:hypothetical protein
MNMDSTCIVLVLASCLTEIRIMKAANSKPKHEALCKIVLGYSVIESIDKNL